MVLNWITNFNTNTEYDKIWNIINPQKINIASQSRQYVFGDLEGTPHTIKVTTEKIFATT